MIFISSLINICFIYLTQTDNDSLKEWMNNILNIINKYE